jgi:hypothetical protein
LGAYKTPANVKLVVGLLGSDLEILKRIREILTRKFGPEEEVLSPIPFVWTQYYSDEVGASPWRTFLTYENLIPRENVVDIKRYTNALELDFAPEGLRRVNIDPGYLTLGQFFLATTKDQRHRVYIRDGIFVEPTLYFQDGTFHPFDWTYRDYRSAEYLAYFQSARSKLAYQMHHQGLPYSKRKARTDPGTAGAEPDGKESSGEGGG